MDVNFSPKEREIFTGDTTEVRLEFDRVIRGTHGGQHRTRRSSSLVTDRPSKITGFADTE